MMEKKKEKKRQTKKGRRLPQVLKRQPQHTSYLSPTTVMKFKMKMFSLLNTQGEE